MRMSPQEKWSKLVLIASTILVAYSVVALAVMHHRHSDEHHRQNWMKQFRGNEETFDKLHAYHCPAHYLILLALGTGLTGMFAGFNSHRRCAMCYVTLLCLLWFSLLAGVSHRAMKGYERCAEAAQRIVVEQHAIQFDFPEGQSIVAEFREVKGVAIDQQVFGHCTEGIHHHVAVSLCILFVIFCSLIFCAMKLRHTSRTEEAPQPPVEAFVVQCKCQNPEEAEETDVLVTRF